MSFVSKSSLDLGSAAKNPSSIQFVKICLLNTLGSDNEPLKNEWEAAALLDNDEREGETMTIWESPVKNNVDFDSEATSAHQQLMLVSIAWLDIA